MRYAISGSGDGHWEYPGNIKNYCFEQYYKFFDTEKDSGEYIGYSSVKENPSLLRGFDIWILEYHNSHDDSLYELIYTIKEFGCKVFIDLHAPTEYVVHWFSRLIETSNRLSLSDGIFILAYDNLLREQIEILMEKPTLDILIPPPKDYSPILKRTPLPFKENEYALIPFPLEDGIMRRSEMTICALGEIGIPTISQVPKDLSWSHYKIMTRLEKKYKKLIFSQPLPYEEYLYLVKKSLFVINSTIIGSLGRVSLDAALTKSLCLGPNAGWQRVLYPEAIVEYGPEMIQKIESCIANRVYLIEKAKETLISYDVQASINRFRNFINY